MLHAILILEDVYLSGLIWIWEHDYLLGGEDSLSVKMSLVTATTRIKKRMLAKSIGVGFYIVGILKHQKSLQTGMVGCTIRILNHRSLVNVIIGKNLISAT